MSEEEVREMQEKFFEEQRRIAEVENERRQKVILVVILKLKFINRTFFRKLKSTKNEKRLFYRSRNVFRKWRREKYANESKERKRMKRGERNTFALMNWREKMVIKIKVKLKYYFIEFIPLI